MPDYTFCEECGSKFRHSQTEWEAFWQKPDTSHPSFFRCPKCLAAAKRRSFHAIKVAWKEVWRDIRAAGEAARR